MRMNEIPKEYFDRIAWGNMLDFLDLNSKSEIHLAKRTSIVISIAIQHLKDGLVIEHLMRDYPKEFEILQELVSIQKLAKGVTTVRACYSDVEFALFESFGRSIRLKDCGLTFFLICIKELMDKAVKAAEENLL